MTKSPTTFDRYRDALQQIAATGDASSRTIADEALRKRKGGINASEPYHTGFLLPWYDEIVELLKVGKDRHQIIDSIWAKTLEAGVTSITYNEYLPAGIVPDNVENDGPYTRRPRSTIAVKRQRVAAAINFIASKIGLPKSLPKKTDLSARNAEICRLYHEGKTTKTSIAKKFSISVTRISEIIWRDEERRHDEEIDRRYREKYGDDSEVSESKKISRRLDIVWPEIEKILGKKD